MNKVILFFMVAVTLRAPCFAQNSTETLTISTYYPAPFGVYRNLKLNPTATEPSGPAATRGVMYYDTVFDKIRYLNNTQWVNLTEGGGGLWNLTGTYITNTNTGVVRIGVAGVPEAYGPRLDVHGGGIHFFTAGTGGLLFNWPSGATSSTVQGRTAAEGNGDLILNVFGGNVGVGTNAPTAKLDVNGSLRATSFIGVGDFTTTGNVTAAAFFYSSDRSLKKNIRPLSNSLAKVSRLQGTSFQWKAGSRQDVGLVAQDVEKVYPELVSTDRNSGLKSVAYGNLIAVLIEAVKEQQKGIQRLEAEVAQLKEGK
jgi:hypothetical protein